MEVLRLAAFTDGDHGGNPAGVVIGEHLPSEADMQRIAAEVGYSETAFAKTGSEAFRVRYFSPETEVPFCGHATIALGGALAWRKGSGVYPLVLNDAKVSVEAALRDGVMTAALQSPPTKSRPADPELQTAGLRLFGLSQDDLDPRLPPAYAEGGASHLIVALRSRKRLAKMTYDLPAGRKLMRDSGLVTIALIYAEEPTLFHARNAFASGGVLEDPATGAAAAALAGYLRDIDWPHDNRITIIQGEDMGSRSVLTAELSDVEHSSIRVSGSVREIG